MLVSNDPTAYCDQGINILRLHNCNISAYYDVMLFCAIIIGTLYMYYHPYIYHTAATYIYHTAATYIYHTAALIVSFSGFSLPTAVLVNVMYVL